jgi:N-acetylglucosamine kinase-like BadF-type ATPase
VSQGVHRAGNRVLLGVDGGNTKTIALVARADGTVIGAGRVTDCADPYAVGLERAVTVITAATEAALAQAGEARVGYAAFSLAGADWPEDLEDLGRALHVSWPDALVVNDGIGALRAAVPEGPGVVVALGTGAATAARGIDGRTWHSSFWQEPQGARELGARALQAVYRAELGIEGPTVLTQRVLERVGEATVEGVLHRATRRGPTGWREPAMLATLVLDAAEEGDPAAFSIVHQQGLSLGRTALAAARKVGIDRLAFPVALCGGVLRHPGSVIEQALLMAVRAGAPSAWPVRPPLEPAAGALLLAFDRAGVTVHGEVGERLIASLPADALFDTHPDSAPA